jgi:hypothetical protein
MLERHRRRMDGVFDIVDPLVVPRIDGERVHSGPVLGGRDDLALRARGGQAFPVGDDLEIGRLVEGDWNSRAGRQRAAQPAAEIPPWRADGVPPGCMQRSADANEPFVFDKVARGSGSLGVQQEQI